MTGTPFNTRAAVARFHEAFGQPVRTEPTVPPRHEAELRERLLKEEVEEYLQASLEEDIVGVADALADILYVTYGAAHYWGIDLDKVVEEVHCSNMRKLGPDGKPIRRIDGKVLKPEGWKPPRIAAVLGLKEEAL